jgi:ribosomal protein S18 acetylase RimI-like enzyme
MELRAMTMDDYDAVAGLWRATEYMGLHEEDDGPGGVARFLARNPGLSLAGYEYNRLVAAALVGHDGRRGVIRHLAVAKDCRGRGYGAQVEAEARRRLAAAGIRRSMVLVFKHNPGGLAFWRRLGWDEWNNCAILSKINEPEP